MEYKFSCKIQFNSLLIVVERKDREKQTAIQLEGISCP